MYDDDTWQTVVELAAIAARPVHQRFSRFVEFEDLKQSACEYAVRRKDKVSEYLDREDPGAVRQGEAAMITFLRRHCERVARKEKATVLGYRVEDEYFYRPALLEALIKVWGSGDNDSANQVLDPAEMGGRRKKLANEGNDLLAMIADVDAAMSKLDARTYGIICLRYVNEATLQDIGDQWGISAQRVDQLIERGMRQLVKALGGRRPY
jgi:RNA polymerase sigma factor (sigma-70 family)